MRVLPHNNLVRAQTTDNRTHARIIHILFTYPHTYTLARTHNGATQESSTASAPPRTGQWTWRTFSQPTDDGDDTDVISSLANIGYIRPRHVYTRHAASNACPIFFRSPLIFSIPRGPAINDPAESSRFQTRPIRAHGDVSYIRHRRRRVNNIICIVHIIIYIYTNALRLHVPECNAPATEAFNSWKYIVTIIRTTTMYIRTAKRTRHT